MRAIKAHLIIRNWWMEETDSRSGTEPQMEINECNHYAEGTDAL